MLRLYVLLLPDNAVESCVLLLQVYHIHCVIMPLICPGHLQDVQISIFDLSSGPALKECSVSSEEPRK